MASWSVETSPGCAGTCSPSHGSIHITSSVLPFTLMMTQMMKLSICLLCQGS